MLECRGLSSCGSSGSLCSCGMIFLESVLLMLLRDSSLTCGPTLLGRRMRFSSIRMRYSSYDSIAPKKDYNPTIPTRLTTNGYRNRRPAWTSPSPSLHPHRKVSGKRQIRIQTKSFTMIMCIYVSQGGGGYFGQWRCVSFSFILIQCVASQMGSYLSRNEQQISESLREEYDIEAQPYLLHRRTQQLCTLHKLTTSSQGDAARIRQAIEEYTRTRCESISKLRTHYHLASSGYCSDQQSFFLVFEGQNSYSLREETAKRRLYRTAFSEQEIQQVAETLLCGLREYDHRFQRDYERLSLECLLIDQQTHRLYLRDPWLAGEQSSHADPLTSLLLHYPSPEKLRAAHSSKCDDYKQFLSNLFSVGAIALELKRLEFADGIYLKKREVNYEEVRARIAEVADERLRKGLECLMDGNPNERKKIYQLWGIQNREEHYLQPILTHKDDTSPINKVQRNPRDASPISLSHFHPSAAQLQQQGLKMVPSEVLIVPPLTLQQHGRTDPPTNSSRTNKSDHSPIRQTHPHITYQPKSNFSPVPTNNIQFQPPYFQTLSTKPPNSPLPSFIQFNHPPNQYHPVNNIPNGAFSLPFTPPPSFHQMHTRRQVQQPSHKLQQPINGPQAQIPLLLPPTVANSAISKPQSNRYSFNPLGDYKESIYEAPRPSNVQTYTESPPKEREVRSILLEEKYEVHPPFEKSPSIIDKIFAGDLDHHEDPPSKEDHPSKEDAKAAEKKEDSSASKEQPYLIAQESDNNSISQQQHDTPNRPTAKNKYNSTIVQVRDEDSPLHSEQSMEAVEQEYVVEQYQTGSRYQGFKSNSMRNGRGKFYYQDGGYYEGQWRNNKMDGEGRLYYEGGKLAYEGSWAQDEFNGAGKVYNDNPVLLHEPFDFTNFELLEDYWEYYEGMLVRDTKEGRGKIKLSNGEIFEGDFHSDRIQGFGKFYTCDGKVIEGIWRESKLIKVINNER